MSASRQETVALYDELPFALEPQDEPTTSSQGIWPAIKTASIATYYTEETLYSEDFQELNDWVYFIVQPSEDQDQSRDNFLDWDPWGDDHIQYPNNFHGQRARIESPLDEPSYGTIDQVDTDTTIPDKECAVCCATKGAGDFPEVPHQADEGNTEHESDVCRSCWYEFLESEVAESRYDAVNCVQCSHSLAEHEIRKLAKTTTYNE